MCLSLIGIVVFFFFFQAEDGIRDYKVTGVQTCALPIYVIETGTNHDDNRGFWRFQHTALLGPGLVFKADINGASDDQLRSEERRVGEEGRSRWSPYH